MSAATGARWGARSRAGRAAAVVLLCMLGIGIPAQQAVPQGAVTDLAAEGGARALARVLPAETVATDRGERLTLDLGLSVPVPWRAFTLADPPRLVLDFREVGWDGLDEQRLLSARGVSAARFGIYRPGWSRLVLELTREMRVETAAMRTGRADGGAVLSVLLRPGAASGPLAGAAPEASAHLWATPPRAGAAPPRTRQRGDRPLVVMLDPGHGGIDPGAQAGGVTEADLMLTFARELRDILRATGRFQVEMTRDDHIFVSLPTRVTQAWAAGA
ncbi:MAG: N-acetylmuramoyl-L-alanine amidase, partial [Rhodobacteraceae bacterium]|nr:N-acetylmuramoyl-L-alanine amidase [Paracoccaceae bacterium]